MAHNVQTLKAQQDTDDERIALLRTLAAQFAHGFFAEIDAFIVMTFPHHLKCPSLI